MKAAFTRLSGVDHMLLVTEKPRAPQHIGGLCIVDATPLLDTSGSLDLVQIKRRLEERMSRVPELRRLVRRVPLLCGRPVWTDDPNFSLDNHVHTISVAPPGDEQQVLTTTELLLRPLLDRAHPLWELWFLTGLEGSRLGLLFKVHHAIADGLAAVALISSLFDSEPDSADVGSAAWSPMPAPATRQLFTDNVRAKLAALGSALAHPVRNTRTAGTALATSVRMMPRMNAAPRTSLNQPLRQERRLGVVHMDLDVARNVAHAHGGKINDVVLDVVAGGIRDLLAARGELGERLELIAGVPVSMRSSARARELGNEVGVFSVRLPVWEVDPGRRLHGIATATSAAKADQPSIQLSNQLGMALFGWLDAAGFPVLERQRMINFMVSNVPGPIRPLYVLGAEIQNVMPFLPLFGNETLTFVALSFCGRLNLLFVADKAACPDADVLTRGMTRTWQQLASIPVAA